MDYRVHAQLQDSPNGDEKSSPHARRLDHLFRCLIVILYTRQAYWACGDMFEYTNQHYAGDVINKTEQLYFSRTFFQVASLAGSVWKPRSMFICSSAPCFSDSSRTAVTHASHLLLGFPLLAYVAR